MVKLSKGKNASSSGSTRVHMLSQKVHLCWMSVSWLLGRPCVSSADGATTETLCPPQVGLAFLPHLVKRSQALDSWPSSGADQWQSILKTLLLRQENVPAFCPGNGMVEHTVGRALKQS